MSFNIEKLFDIEKLAEKITIKMATREENKYLHPFAEAVANLIRTAHAKCEAKGDYNLKRSNEIILKYTERVEELERALEQLLTEVREYRDTEFPAYTHDGPCGPESGCEAEYNRKVRDARDAVRGKAEKNG